MFVALIAATTTTTTTTALASPGSDERDQTATRSTSLVTAVSLTGTWTTQVRLTDAPPGAPAGFSALDTSQRDGGILVSSSTPSPASRSLAHGSWTQLRDRQFNPVFVWFRFDAAGGYLGSQRVQRTIDLSRDRAPCRSTDLFEVIAPNSTVVASFHGTEVAERLVVDAQ